MHAGYELGYAVVPLVAASICHVSTVLTVTGVTGRSHWLAGDSKKRLGESRSFRVMMVQRSF